jgi:signal transduction histidine kinase
VDGKIEGSVAVVIDVTDRKHAEDALRAAYERAEAATRAKDEFLSVVSHELRTPAGFDPRVYTAVERCDAGCSHGPASCRNRREKQQNAVAADRNLLDTARILSGKLRLDVQPLDLSGVISAALDVVRPAAQAKGIELHSALDLSGA